MIWPVFACWIPNYNSSGQRLPVLENLSAGGWAAWYDWPFAALKPWFTSLGFSTPLTLTKGREFTLCLYYFFKSTLLS